MLENYTVVHFTIRLDSFKIVCIIKESGTQTIVSASSFFTHTHFSCSTCKQQLLTKAGVKSEIL